MDVHCSGVIEDYIKLRSVKRLKPRKRANPDAPRTWWTHPGTPDNTDWLTPKLYKGTSDQQDGLLQRLKEKFAKKFT